MIPADLHPDRITALLRSRYFGRSLQVVPSTGSTNDDARKAATRGAAHGHTIVADAQQQGRGSHGRSWSSPAGRDLYFSIVARLPLAPHRVPPLTLAVGVGLAEAVDALLAPEIPSQVKWPNDLWLGEKKCAGILVEACTQGDTLDALVIGVGLNVNRRSWPGELQSEATSLAQHAGRLQDRATVLAAALAHVEATVARFVEHGPAEIIAALQPRLALRDRRVRCGSVTGTLLGVADTGALRIACESGVEDVHAGTLRPA